MPGKSFEEIGLDTSIPHIGVIMEKTNPTEYPIYALPEGYTFAPYRPGMEHIWSELQASVEHANSVEEARALFESEFMAHPEELPARMVFVLDKGGKAAGTISLWDGNHFGRTLQRVHWVAVSPAHQGKGISKAMMTKVLDIFGELGYKDYIYLTSQTWSYKALHVYMKFGFRPYFGEKPENWRAVDLVNNNEPWDYEAKNREAWAIIYEKIEAYRRKQSYMHRLWK